MNTLRSTPEQGTQWQREVTTRLFRMQHALGEQSAKGCIVGANLEHTAGETISDWLQEQSHQVNDGRVLRINLGRGAVFSSFEKVTEPGDLYAGMDIERRLEPRNDETEIRVDNCRLVNLAPSDESPAHVGYFLHDLERDEWISVREVGESISGQISFVASSAAHQEALDMPTGAQLYVPKDLDTFSQR
ncbi:MAG TPA: hypothetical protein VFZ48_04080 [Candidatus Saccharimonadales bacterium]